MGSDHHSTTDPTPSLSENDYWAIIDMSIARAYDMDSQEAMLRLQLQGLPTNQIVDFEVYTQRFLAESYRSDLWCAADIINRGCSNDGFDYFRGWLISRGKEVFEATMKDPDGTLARVVDPAVPFYDFETFLYVAEYSYEHLTGKSLFDLMAEKGKFTSHPKLNLDWSPGTPASYRRVCPQLFSLYDKFNKKPQQPGSRKKINTEEFRKKYRRR